jgi:Ca-activated chloride channel family protein
MSFGSPWLLLFLLVVPLAVGLYVALDRRRTAKAAAWSRPALLPNMISASPGWRRRVPLVLFLLGLTLLLVGFARPQAKVEQVREGATVILAMDISGSMAAKDVRPTRLRAADAAVATFVKKLPAKYRVSVLTFSDHVAVKLPPTYDRAAVMRALPTKAEAQGTALGDGVAAAVKVARKAIGPTKPGVSRPPATILVLSDGAQNAGRIDAKTAAAQARKAGVPVSTVSLGTAAGVVVTKLPGGAGVERQQVPPAPATLKAVAQATGGRFFTAGSAKQLTEVYKDLGSRLVKDKKKREITGIAVGAALAAMIAGALLSGVWFRRLV